MLEKRREREKWELVPSNPGSFHQLHHTTYLPPFVWSNLTDEVAIEHVGEWTMTWEVRETTIPLKTPELSNSNIIDTGTSSHPGHGRVLQPSHTVHLSR